jgi:Sugar kinases, ribokinase family
VIVVIGEALIDLIEDKTASGRYRAVVGGANANVAIALARLGAKQQLLARISSDAFGQRIRQRLIDNSVGLDHAIAATQQSTVAIASIGESGGANYSFYVENTADWGWTTGELPTDQALQSLGATTIQFGCLSMAMPPGNKVIEAWAKEFFDKELLTISHDINVRPALGFEVSIERERVERVNSFSHLIKASDDDIAWLYGLEAASDSGEAIDQIAWDWIGDTAKIVFVTRGGEGVSVYRRGKTRIDVSSRKVQVQDTVGAGDTFCANTLVRLDALSALGANAFERLAKVSDQELSEIARVSGIAASMACEKIGAEPPTAAELEALLATLGG